MGVIFIYIALLIIVVWFVWGNFIYKWNTDRIGSLALKKYQPLNQNLLTADTYFDYSDVLVSDDKKKVNMKMNIKNSSGVITSSQSVEYDLIDGGIFNTNACDLIALRCITV